MNLSPNAQAWLVYGEQGLSSKAMFHRLVLGAPVDPFHYPHDVDDFQRCERLLRAVPELRPDLPRMASVSPVWAGLVTHWDEIVASVEAEYPGVLDGGWDACRVPYWERYQRTEHPSYDLMDRIIEEGRARR